MAAESVVRGGEEGGVSRLLSYRRCDTATWPQEVKNCPEIHPFLPADLPAEFSRKMT